MNQRPSRFLDRCLRAGLASLLILCLSRTAPSFGDEFATGLPEGVKAVWDLGQAVRETTPTRERICINGLWRWQPAEAANDRPPVNAWGYFKVPGCWPGITDYLQKDSQTLHAHPTWQDRRLSAITTAWYERELEVPGQWRGRRILLSLDYLNSHATVFLDGKLAGEIQFPGGDLDLTAVCGPGTQHRLSILVQAMPLKGVMLSYTDSASARQVRGNVQRRGLCGDAYLVSLPAATRLGEVAVETSVRRGEITLSARLDGLLPGSRYKLQARALHQGKVVKEFSSLEFSEADLRDRRLRFTTPWKPDRLWDLHTPNNVYSLETTLINAQGDPLDTAWTERFGFREFWIDGRDFYLNGTRLFLSSVPFDNAQISAAAASYQEARESLERLKAIGINYVYTHNYGCEPGSHLGFDEVLRAADDVGVLVGLSQPHFSHYDWKAAEADQTNGYARHAAYYVHQARNHPAVVFYSMSHNATGYNDDMNPDMIDGLSDPRDNWSRNNARLALRAEAIVSRLDPSRIVYHHASGNLGAMHSSNFYPNFVPIQELSDWFQHWADKGVKPVFTCEYGAPFTWDWAMYRGWYKGERSFGSARVPWELCFAEWNAQFLGDRAYKISEMEKANLRWEAKQFQAGNLWHRWDYPYEIGSPRFDDRHEVIGRYLTDNFRAYRTLGVSAISPWEHGHFWSLKAGVDKRRKSLPVDWDKLQRPGFSPDFLGDRYERVDLAYERSDWIPTADGQALLRNNQPLLAYLGGPSAEVTSKGHNVQPGALIDKQIVLINNSRSTVTCECAWSLNLPEPAGGTRSLVLPTGRIETVPVRLNLPATLAAGAFDLSMTVKFSGGETQKDLFTIHVLPPAPAPERQNAKTRIALFDPKGETSSLLKAMGCSFRIVEANADLSSDDLLIIGKSALTLTGPVPRLDRVREGLKVLVFEQTAEVLEQRLGFRVAEYGLRQVFPRVQGHPVLQSLTAENLRDWQGSATLVAPRLTYPLQDRQGPKVKWCDIPVTRAWRGGNRGNVASVSIEKPARGDFLPILDGGFSLQYSQLLEYREGRGMVLFSQLDLTGRDAVDPAADWLTRNILDYVSNWNPAPRRSVVYAGEPAGLQYLQSAGWQPRELGQAALSPDQVLVVGPGGGRILASRADSIANWINKDGGRLLAIGLDDQEANAFLPFQIKTRRAEHIACWFPALDARSLFAGVGPADVHNRDPRQLALIQNGATVLGDGILAQAVSSSAVFCQFVPWQFAAREGQFNVKRTQRRAACLVSRLIANMGGSAATPLLERFETPVKNSASEQRFLTGMYLDQPEEWDDPYRFFRW